MYSATVTPQVPGAMLANMRPPTSLIPSPRMSRYCHDSMDNSSLKFVRVLIVLVEVPCPKSIGLAVLLSDETHEIRRPLGQHGRPSQFISIY